VKVKFLHDWRYAFIPLLKIMKKKEMESWITLEVSIKFEDLIVDNNSETMNDFLEGTRDSIGESLNINPDNVKINMVKQEQPIWFDEFGMDEKVEA